MSWYPIVRGFAIALLSTTLLAVYFGWYSRRLSRRHKVSKFQSYEQLKRSRDSLAFMCGFFIFWVGIHFDTSADLIAYLGFWTGPVFVAGLIIIERSAWLVFYLIDRRKAADGGRAAKT